jgi:acyl carrier protein
MSREDVLVKINEIFADAFDRNDLNIRLSTSASDVDGWDSLMQMNLIEMIEGEFNISFDMDEIVGMSDVGAMIDGIISKI